MIFGLFTHALADNPQSSPPVEHWSAGRCCYAHLPAMPTDPTSIPPARLAEAAQPPRHADAGSVGAGIAVAALILGVGSCAMILWAGQRWVTSNPAAQTMLIGLMATAIIASLAAVVCISPPAQRRALLGLRWRTGWRSALGASMLAAVGLLIAGLLLGSLAWPTSGLAWFGEYLPLLVLQQLLLQGLVAQSLGIIVARRSDQPGGHHLKVAIAVAAGLVFALLHAPNPMLMALTAPAGAAWVWHFRRHHNLAAVAVSHLLLGIAAMLCLGRGLLMDLAVGAVGFERLMGR